MGGLRAISTVVGMVIFSVMLLAVIGFVIEVLTVHTDELNKVANTLANRVAFYDSLRSIDAYYKYSPYSETLQIYLVNHGEPIEVTALLVRTDTSVIVYSKTNPISATIYLDNNAYEENIPFWLPGGGNATITLTGISKPDVVSIALVRDKNIGRITAVPIVTSEGAALALNASLIGHLEHIAGDYTEAYAGTISSTITYGSISIKRAGYLLYYQGFESSSLQSIGWSNIGGDWVFVPGYNGNGLEQTSTDTTDGWGGTYIAYPVSLKVNSSTIYYLLRFNYQAIAGTLTDNTAHIALFSSPSSTNPLIIIGVDVFIGSRRAYISFPFYGYYDGTSWIVNYYYPFTVRIGTWYTSLFRINKATGIVAFSLYSGNTLLVNDYLNMSSYTSLLRDMNMTGVGTYQADVIFDDLVISTRNPLYMNFTIYVDNVPFSGTLEVYDSSGNLVYSTTVSNGEAVIDAVNGPAIIPGARIRVYNSTFDSGILQVSQINSSIAALVSGEEYIINISSTRTVSTSFNGLLVAVGGSTLIDVYNASVLPPTYLFSMDVGTTIDSYFGFTYSDYLDAIVYINRNGLYELKVSNTSTPTLLTQQCISEGNPELVTLGSKIIIVTGNTYCIYDAASNTTTTGTLSSVLGRDLTTLGVYPAAANSTDKAFFVLYDNTSYRVFLVSYSTSNTWRIETELPCAKLVGLLYTNNGLLAMCERGALYTISNGAANEENVLLPFVPHGLGDRLVKIGSSILFIRADKTNEIWTIG